MTVSEFVKSYPRCAIHDVPLESAKVLSALFPTTNWCNDFQAYVDSGRARPIVQMRFVEGTFFNWMNGETMHYGVGAPYDLSAVAPFAELEMEDEEDEIDVSFEALVDLV